MPHDTPDAAPPEGAAPSASAGPFSPRWTLRPLPDEGTAERLARDLNDLSPALARALALRGVGSFEEARSFFRADLGGLHDPFLMRDMEAAADRLVRAIRARERVVVYGDYDVDGTTSTAMMTTFLAAMGTEASFFIPNRFVHGYGLSEAGLDEAAARGATLVVALDCGISALHEARYARSLGLDLVICDHHTALDEIPDAVAVLDPKRPDCDYPFDGLSGCGVGFKLIQAVLHRLGRPPEEAWPFLDLVAVSTASDIVPMVGENRILMREGLGRLCGAGARVGLQALAARAGVDLATCTSSRIVFQLGPRINAAGRLEDASVAAHLLASTDPEEARALVEVLEEINGRRRTLDHQTRDEALAQAASFMDDDPVALVIHREGWHPGVIGITASRVAERFHRPTVLLTSGPDGVARGSARSVKGISVYDALARCADLLDRFGGHAFAAGLSLPVERVPELRARLQEAVAVQTPRPLVPEIELDAPLGLGEITPRFWRVLGQFGPHGPGNLAPTFWGRGLRVVGQPACVGAERQHLRLRVAQVGGGPTFPVIGFGLADRHEAALTSIRRGQPLELAFQVDENHWNGHATLQLRAQDLRLDPP